MPNYIQVFEDHLQKKFPVCPPDLIKLYALISLVTRGNASAEDIHNAWAVRKNETFPEHRSLVPYNSLPEAIRLRDMKYVKEVNDCWFTYCHLVDFTGLE